MSSWRIGLWYGSHTQHIQAKSVHIPSTQVRRQAATCVERGLLVFLCQLRPPPPPPTQFFHRLWPAGVVNSFILGRFCHTLGSFCKPPSVAGGASAVGRRRGCIAGEGMVRRQSSSPCLQTAVFERRLGSCRRHGPCLARVAPRSCKAVRCLLGGAQQRAYNCCAATRSLAVGVGSSLTVVPGVACRLG